MTSLIKYETARAALAEARSVDEVKDIHDKAEAMRHYARIANDTQLEADAAELRERAERRLGIMLTAAKAAGQMGRGQPKKNSAGTEEYSRIKLEDAGISHKLSARAQKKAGIAERAYDAMIDRMRAEIIGGRRVADVLKVDAGPINGSRSIMGSRQEPDDSLDYFPTPPWATRALMERIWPVAVPSGRRYSAWEPACGEGHIAEVLREYFDLVVSTDIHDYGYGQSPVDFLGETPPNMSPEWIITNPPFGDKAEAFVLKALDRATVGVAMFVRQQWLEGINRYNTIFKPHPPSLIAQFSERVPLCKGRWDPLGGTATAYCWIIWMPARQSARALTEFFWVPPGCREECSRPDDAERFTTSPVTKADHRTPADASGSPLIHDRETGEVEEPVRPLTYVELEIPEGGTYVGLPLCPSTATADAGGNFNTLADCQRMPAQPFAPEIEDLPKFLRVENRDKPMSDIA